MEVKNALVERFGALLTPAKKPAVPAPGGKHLQHLTFMVHRTP
jgi:hypothetical protein